MLRRAVYFIFLLGLAQSSAPTAAQQAEDFSVAPSPASDPTVKLIDLTGVNPDDYDEEELTPALIEKIREQQEEAQSRREATPLEAAPEIIYSAPAVTRETRPGGAVPSAAPDVRPTPAPAPSKPAAAAAGSVRANAAAGRSSGIRETFTTQDGRTSTIVERIEVAPASGARDFGTPTNTLTATPTNAAPGTPSSFAAPADINAGTALEGKPLAPAGGASHIEGTALLPAAAAQNSAPAADASETPAAAASQSAQPKPQNEAEASAQALPAQAVSTYAFADVEPLPMPIAAHPADDDIKKAYQAYNDKKLDALKKLAAQTKGHPLHDYVELWQIELEARLAADKSVKGKPRTAVAAKMSAQLTRAFEDFVKKHEGDYLAERARTDWARLAARAHDSRTFRRLYEELAWNKSEPDLLCWSAYFNLEGNAKGALQQAKVALLNTTNDQGTSCRTLAEAVLKRQPSWGWTYALILAQKKRFSIASDIISATPQKYLPAPAKTLTTMLSSPTRWYQQNRRRLGKMNAKTLLLASLRTLAVDVDRAAQIASHAEGRMSEATRAMLWGRLGYEAAVDQKPSSLDYYAKAGSALAQAHQGPITVAGETLKIWRVRAALREGNAKAALAAINALSAKSRAEPAWIYWKGRLLLDLGQKEQGERLLRTISKRLDFYGLLACDALGVGYASPQAALAPAADPAHFAAFAKNDSLLRAMHFYALDLYGYGHREWNWALGSMKNRTRLELAQWAARLGLEHREINTAASAAPAVFTLRYPTPHRKEIEVAAESAGLPPAWVYGLIRQESRFIAAVSSSAGAVGMMQIMPKTGRWVAKKIGMDNFRTSDLTDMQTNLILGTNYLKMVAESVGGSLPLAAASYNAGPSRAQAWRASLPRTVDGAVFTETIPFGETRNYVMQVSANIAAYSRYSDAPMRITDILGTIAPQAADPNPLP